MADLNLTYSLDSEPAILGMVSDSRVGFNTITKKIELAAGIPAGKLVKKGTAVGSVTVLSAVGDYVVGATRWSPSMVTDEAGVTTYKQNKFAPIFTEGPIWLNAQEAIAEDDLVYAVISGAGKIGDVKKTSGADTTTKPVGRAETVTTGADQLVRIYLRPALQGA